MSVKIKLLTNRQPYSNGEYPIVLRICKDKKVKVISTGYTCSKKLWDFEKNLPKNSYPNAGNVKKIITKHRDTVAANIDNVFEKPKQEDPNIKLIEFIDSIKGNLSAGNLNVYMAFRNMFSKFKQGDVLIKEIDVNLISEYEKFLKKKGNSINGNAVHLKTFRAIINKAIEKYNLDMKNPFNNYKIVRQQTSQPALDIKYIKKMKDLKLSGRTELVRDVFLFSFYTMGMNISNICYLKKKDIQGDYIIYIRKKLENQSTKQIKIKLTRPILELIEKWDEDPVYVFPIVKNDPYKDYLNFKRYANNKLKEIGEKIGCPTKLTTNVARHTWASRAANMNYPVSVIRDALNHKDTKTTEHYLDTIDNRVINDANDKITDI